MASLTLLEIRNRAKKRADVEIEEDGRHDPDDVRDMINDSLREYHGLHAQYGLAIELQDIVTTSSATTISAGLVANQYISLPANIHKVKALRIQGSSSSWTPLTQFADGDPALNWDSSGIPCQYKLGTNSAGTLIARLYPPASGAYSIRVLYIPGLTPLVDDSDAYTFVDGTEEYVVCDVAMKLLESDGVPEPSQSNSLAQRKADAQRRLQLFASSVDGVAPPTMITRRNNRAVSL